MRPISQVTIRLPDQENEYSMGVNFVFENFMIGVVKEEIANKTITIHKTGTYPRLQYRGLIAEVTTEVAEKMAEQANVSYY